jgi:transcriptional regulator with XRE-family HTH domain
MARPEKPLKRDGSPLHELAYWLRDLRSRADLTYDQLASRTNFSRATLQEALSGKRLPTWPVTQAIVRACAGDVDLWHIYWDQIRRTVNRDAPAGSIASITPPWIEEASSSSPIREAPLPGNELKGNEAQATRFNIKLHQRPWAWMSAGGVVLVVVGILIALLLTGGSSPTTTNFPNPNHHPKAPRITAVTHTYTEQEFNPNGASTFAHLDGSGAGIPVAYGQYVQVSCKVYSTIVKSTKPDGYWYRLASLPWDNHYYAAANTFGNGDKLNHPPYTHNTDWRVPNCR